MHLLKLFFIWLYWYYKAWYLKIECYCLFLSFILGLAIEAEVVYGYQGSLTKEECKRLGKKGDSQGQDGRRQVEVANANLLAMMKNFLDTQKKEGSAASG